MPRPMTPGFAAAIASSELRPALFVMATFTTGPVYLWTGIGSLVWNGQTWLGVGSLGSVSTIEEGASVEAKGISLSLSGIDPALLTDVLIEFQVGLPVMIYLGMFDTSGALIPSPIVSWAGKMDQPTIDVSGETATITIACENRMVDLNVAVDRRYTHDDQQIDYPGDLGFQFVTSIQGGSIYWGRAPSSINNA